MSGVNGISIQGLTRNSTKDVEKKYCYKYMNNP